MNTESRGNIIDGSLHRLRSPNLLITFRRLSSTSFSCTIASNTSSDAWLRYRWRRRALIGRLLRNTVSHAASLTMATDHRTTCQVGLCDPDCLLTRKRRRLCRMSKAQSSTISCCISTLTSSVVQASDQCVQPAANTGGHANTRTQDTHLMGDTLLAKRQPMQYQHCWHILGSYHHQTSAPAPPCC